MPGTADHWRPGPYRRYEVLHEPADLAAQADRSRLTPTPVLEISQAGVVGARRLRDALFRVVIAHTRSEPYPPGDLEVINQAAARLALAPRHRAGREAAVGRVGVHLALQRRLQDHLRQPPQQPALTGSPATS